MTQRTLDTIKQAVEGSPVNEDFDELLASYFERILSDVEWCLLRMRNFNE